MQYVNSNEEIKAAYIHIPFCDKICSYCDFCKQLYNKNLVDKYLESLSKEINEEYQKEVLKTIYIGGGTPSSLTPTQLKKLFEIISIIKKDKNYEMTVECNFENITKEKLDIMKQNGVNRISFGMQSTINKNLEFLNRSFSKKKIVDIINYSKEIGLTNINIDLMYAIPNQTIEDLNQDLKFVLSLDIPHISTYSLIIEDHTLLKIKNTKPISEDLDSSMYNFISDILKKNNYIHYEISNFSKKGYESKHNLVYWKNEKYYGFGLGASSYIGNKRIVKTKSFQKYIQGNRIYEEEILTNEDEIAYQIILNLRLKEGIDKKNFKRRFYKEVKECYNYDSLVKQNLLQETKYNIYIKEKHLYISNEIIIKFLEGVVHE